LLRLLLSLFATAGPALRAQSVFEWKGGAGSWGTAGNWNPGSIPNALNADVFIDNSNPADSAVTLSTQGSTVGRLTIDAGDSLLLTDTIVMPHPALVLTLAEGSFAGSGTILNNGTLNIGPLMTLRLGDNNGDHLTFNGTGTYLMEDAPATTISATGVGTVNPCVLTNNSAIRGAGLLNTDVDNTATITATSATNSLKLGGFTCHNTGTLAAAAGATLLVSVPGGGTSTVNPLGLYNTGGVIRADGPGAVVYLEGNGASTGRLRGGTLLTTNGGVIYINGISTILDGSLNPVTIAAGSNVRIGFPTTANTGPDAAGTLIIDGTLTLDGGTTGPDRLQVAASAESGVTPFLTLNGTGAVEMSNSVNNEINGAGAAGHVFTTNIPITGGGKIGGGLIDVVNHSTITANGSAGITVDPSTTVTNDGTLRALSGSTLTLGSGNFENANGIIRAEGDNSLVVVGGNAEVRGGYLAATCTGEMRFASLSRINGSVSAVNISGLGRIPNAASTAWQGMVEIDGTVFMESTGTQTSIGVNGLTLTGTGSIIMTNNANNGIRLTGGGAAAFSNGILIRGAGGVGLNAMNITNSGEMRADQALVLIIDPVTTFTNTATGILRGDGAGGLTLNNGTWTNNGLIEARGGNVTGVTAANFTNYTAATKTLTGGTLRAIGAHSIALASVSQITVNAAAIELSGAGATFAAINPLVTNQGSFTLRNERNFTTAGALTNSGSLRVDGTAVLTVNGNLTQTGDSSALEFDMNPLAAGATYDAIDVNGTAALDGELRLRISFRLNETLDGTETFTLLTSDNPITGAFDNVANGARVAAVNGVGSFKVNYGSGSTFAATSLVLSDFIPSPPVELELVSFSSAPADCTHPNQSAVRMVVKASGGAACDLETSTDLLDWTVLQSGTTDLITGLLAFDLLEPAAVPRRFYRGRLQ
jgi:hypothetical protein